MIIKSLIYFGCLCLFYEYVQLIDIDCEYESESYVQIGSIYRCKIVNYLNITSKETVAITSAKGNHTSGKSNDDVEGFMAYTKNIQHFPKNLQNIFKNIKKISIEYGRIKEISSKDLKPFPKLENLQLYENDIEILEEGVFAYNSDLMLINLRYNKLVHIGHNVFDFLTKLTYLYIEYNPCISMNTDNKKPTAVQVLLNNVYSNCFVPDYTALASSLKILFDEYELITPENFKSFRIKVDNFEIKLKYSRLWNLTRFKDSINKLNNFEHKMLSANMNKLEKLEHMMMNLNESINITKQEDKLSQNWKIIIMVVSLVIQAAILFIGCLSLI
ncbi:hypothetical protein ACKWTF_015427 [Chironomus riparius]